MAPTVVTQPTSIRVALAASLTVSNETSNHARSVEIDFRNSKYGATAKIKNPHA
jgi:Fe-S cluster assembly iron-binding protein IscA